MSSSHGQQEKIAIRNTRHRSVSMRSPVTTTHIPIPRRRKRRHGEALDKSRKQERKSLASFGADDDQFCFAQKFRQETNRAYRSFLGRHSSSSSVPSLLLQREYGYNHGIAALTTTRDFWMRRVITSNDHKYDDNYESYKSGSHCCHKRNAVKPREFVKRTISFQALRTPVTDIVLGVDRTGSFLISIGPAVEAGPSERIFPSHMEGGVRASSQMLYFSGIPSSCVLQRDVLRTPPLLTIPLPRDPPPYHIEDPCGNRRNVMIWMSSDSQVGVAAKFYRDSPVCLVLFSAPFASNSKYFTGRTPSTVPEGINYSLRRTTVSLNQMASTNSSFGHRMLWGVKRAPIYNLPSANFDEQASSQSVPDYLSALIEGQSYLLFFPEEANSYRLTWFRHPTANTKTIDRPDLGKGKRFQNSRLVKGLILPSADSWVGHVSDHHGHEVKSIDPRDRSCRESGLVIVDEARLVLDRISEDLVKRRPSWVIHHFDFAEYQFVGMRGSRQALFLISFFDAKYENLIVGSIEIDLFCSSYRELSWTKRRHLRMDFHVPEDEREKPTMHERDLLRSRKRFLHYRKSQIGIPESFCLHLERCSSILDEWATMVPADHPAARSMPTQTAYPDTEVHDNLTVSQFCPVLSLNSWSGLVELKYLVDEFYESFFGIDEASM